MIASNEWETDMFDERIALGLPCLAGYELFQAIEAVSELGFQSVMSLPGGPRTEHSLGPFPTLEFYDSTEEYRARVKEALAGFKRTSIHQAWDTEWEIWLDCADYFGAEMVMVHAGVRGRDQDPAEFLSDRVQYLRQLGDHAGELGVRIGVETEGGAYDDYVRMIETVDHPSVGATIDVGHCGFFAEVRAFENLDERVEALNEHLCRLVGELGDRIFLFHTHNIRRSDWRDHRSAPDGVIDFRRLFEQCRKIDYRGNFDIELEEEDRETKSRETGELLDSLCSEFLNEGRQAE